MEEGNITQGNNPGLSSKMEGREINRRNWAFPPKLRLHEKIFIFGCPVLILLSALFIINQYCQFILSGILKPCILCTYVAHVLIVVFFVLWNVTFHRFRVHKARIVDKSEADSLLVEARDMLTRGDDQVKAPNNIEGKRALLQDELKRLADIGNRGWTEFQILPLTQMLVEFYNKDEIIAEARSNLAEIKQYAGDSTYRYDMDQYDEWAKRIEETTDTIEDKKSDIKDRDAAIIALRARLQTLLEHVADWERKWTEGSTIIRGIVINGVVTIPILIVTGLIPVLHPISTFKNLGILDWGLLGISGALTAVLLSLHKADTVEVGNTEGEKELWRTVLGTCLGFVAGILLYSMIAGNVISGSAFPLSLSGNPSESDLGRSIFWAVASGFSFEWVFNRLYRNICDKGASTNQ